MGGGKRFLGDFIQHFADGADGFVGETVGEQGVEVEDHRSSSIGLLEEVVGEMVRRPRSAETDTQRCPTLRVETKLTPSIREKQSLTRKCVELG